MSNVSIPRGAAPIRATASTPTQSGASTGGLVGTFRPKGWGISSPIKELTLEANGQFKVSLRGGGTAKGTFEFRDGAAAFMDTLKLKDASGKELLYGVSAQTKGPNGQVSALTLAPIADRVGTPFTLELR